MKNNSSATPDSNSSATPDSIKSRVSELSPLDMLKLNLFMQCTNLKLETGQMPYFPKPTTFNSPRTFAAETSALPVIQCRSCAELCTDPAEYVKNGRRQKR
ncbi:hypothetical protein RLOatenuis_6950 [Rickettsiales bacterium]|nr:hypothetical protein RLOatenuis_6950 [Rickettsiales bacterium]